MLTWTEPDAGVANKTGYRVERANDPSFLTGLVITPLGLATTFTDPIGSSTTPYFYRVAATNTVGSTVAGFPTVTATSGWSNVAAVNPLLAPGPLTATIASPGQIRLTFWDNANNETGFVVERATGVGVDFFPIATLLARNATGSVVYTDTAPVAGTVNSYRVKAVAGLVQSAYSNVAAISMPPIPAAPSAFTAAARLSNNNNKAVVTLTWADNATNETSYSIQRALDPGFTNGVTTFNPASNATTLQDTGVARGTRYYYRIRAVGQGGFSAYVSATPFPIITP